MPVTRGFSRRRSESGGRVAPGQYDVGASWPVLTAEATPRIDRSTWSIGVDGLVDRPTTWTWDEVQQLPRSSCRGDIHCATTWSKFGVVFTAVSVDILLGLAGPQPGARFVMAHSTTGYTTNLPLADLTGGKAWVVWEFDGKPLTTEHGGPVRLLVPHLYFWKSAKWISRLEVTAADRPGFCGNPDCPEKPLIVGENDRTPYDQRQPCPVCGARRRMFAIATHEHLCGTDSAQATVYRQDAPGGGCR